MAKTQSRNAAGGPPRPFAGEAIRDPVTGVERIQVFRKTKMCSFFLNNACERGDKCGYAHDYGEMRHLPDLSRTKMCKNLSTQGACCDPHCRYAHTLAELKRMPKNQRDNQMQQQVPLPTPEVLRSLAPAEDTSKSEVISSPIKVPEPYGLFKRNEDTVPSSLQAPLHVVSSQGQQGPRIRAGVDEDPFLDLMDNDVGLEAEAQHMQHLSLDPGDLESKLERMLVLAKNLCQQAQNVFGGVPLLEDDMSKLELACNAVAEHQFCQTTLIEAPCFVGDGASLERYDSYFNPNPSTIDGSGGQEGTSTWGNAQVETEMCLSLDDYLRSHGLPPVYH